MLAAAPTTPLCFRHWRRSSSLHFAHNQRKDYFKFCNSGKSADFPELPFHRRRRNSKRHSQRRFLRKRGAAEKLCCPAPSSGAARHLPPTGGRLQWWRGDIGLTRKVCGRSVRPFSRGAQREAAFPASKAEKSPGERGAPRGKMQVLRRYAYSLTTKRTRVYSFCLVTVTPNLVGL